jgi:uncharacterized protein with HEPN domain
VTVLGDQAARLARLLDDLARFTAEAGYLTGLGRDAYLEDSPQGSLLRNAGERILIKVATVVERLPADFKAHHPAIAWTAIGRMRNLVAHHYEKVNDDLVWAALVRRLPELADALDLPRPEPAPRPQVTRGELRAATRDHPVDQNWPADLRQDRRHADQTGDPWAAPERRR